jgi:hypothetical protein
MTPKAQATKKLIILHQNLKLLLFIKGMIKKVKSNPQNGRKYLQIIYMIEV